MSVISLDGSHCPVISLAERRLQRPNGFAPALEEGGYLPVTEDRADSLSSFARFAICQVDGTAHGTLLVRPRENEGLFDITYKTTDDTVCIIRPNAEDLEALAFGLEEEGREELKTPLEMFYTLALLAYQRLCVSKRIDPNTRLPDPVINNETTVRLSTSERRIEVTRWRAAAGIGLLAVGKEDESLRGNIRRHLASVIKAQFDHAVHMGALWTALEVEVPREPEGHDDQLLGLCSPLYPWQLKRFLTVKPATK